MAEDDIDEDAPIFAIAAAAELAAMHAQTLRQYDRLGLVVPGRTQGGSRRCETSSSVFATRCSSAPVRGCSPRVRPAPS
ncbi:MAG: transcriptional regulator [Microbacterium sp.]|nr:transcriptional regulator [Microbacterium sp.]